MSGFSSLATTGVAPQGYPISANGISTGYPVSSPMAAYPVSANVAVYSQVPVSIASQTQSTLTRQYSVGAPLEATPVQYAVGVATDSTPVRKSINVSQYSPRQVQRQTQPVTVLSGVAREVSAQVTPAALPATIVTAPSPRAPVAREINADFEVIRLRQQMLEMDSLVEELRSEIVTLRSRLSEQDLKSDDKEEAVVIEELRHEIGDQRQELAELQRLRQIIEDQGNEITELRAKTVELVSANTELESRRAELEEAANRNSTAEIEQVVEVRVSTEEEGIIDDMPLEIEKVATPPTPSRKLRPLRGDMIDLCVQEYLNSRPDFRIAVEKIKPGWYIFGEPISKKLYLKMSGEHVVCRVGGGTKDLVKYLEDFRLCVQDKKDLEVARARVKRLSSREHGF